jgi:hydrogenase nickel incorporation protein HypB
VEVSVLRNVLEANDLIAEENRQTFDRLGCFVVNLMSSPGSGKTAILERTLQTLPERHRTAVVEGDVQGTLDAERLLPYGRPVVQIMTEPHFGGACHLDARMIRGALGHLPLDGLDLVLIENVGNLVCPADIRLGEDRRVVVLSVAEGDDKPLKYPAMFRASHLLLLNKMDLLEHVGFDLARFRAALARVNPTLPVIELSARTGQGVDRWIEWLDHEVTEAAARRASCGAI